MRDEQLKTSKAYQALNQEEPLSSPPELDAAILAQAHKAVQAKPQVVESSPRSHLTLRWGAPIASAALVVLSVTVFILMPELEQQQAIQSYKQDSESEIYSESPEAIPAPRVEVRSEPMFDADMLMDDITMESEQLMAAPVVAQEARQAKQERVKASTAKRIKKAKVIQPAALSRSAASPEVQMQDNAVLSGIASKPMQAHGLEEKLIESKEEALLLSPELWGKNILQLIEQGDWLSADKQYAAFAKHYPEHEFNKEYLTLKKRQTAQQD